MEGDHKSAPESPIPVLILFEAQQVPHLQHFSAVINTALVEDAPHEKMGDPEQVFVHNALMPA